MGKKYHENAFRTKWCLYQITQPLPLKSQILHPKPLNLIADGIIYILLCSMSYKKLNVYFIFLSRFLVFWIDILVAQSIQHLTALLRNSSGF